MSPMPIDPSFSTTGAEWGIGKVDPSVGTGSVGGSGASGTGFGDLLGKQIQGVADTQTDAAEQSRALATGEATDPTQVVMSVERAQLAMQMATTFRNKGVEAVQELMRTQV
jgi:flagellar hook-basal body complex protein FliE